MFHHLIIYSIKYFLSHLGDLPVIFSKGWFIYLRKLVLPLKRTHPPLTELTRKYDMHLKINLVTLVYSSPSPHPIFPTHTRTYIHFSGFPLWGRIGGIPLLLKKLACPPMFPLAFRPMSITVDFVISMQFLAILFKMPPLPLSKSQPIWETLLPVSSTFVNKRQVSKQ